MSSIASMMTNTGLPPGFFQGGLSASHMPAGLERAASNALSKGLSDISTGLSSMSTDDARSYTSQLITEQYSIQITMSLQSSSSSTLSYSDFSSSGLDLSGMPSIGANSVSPTDFSAEATAERIFTFSISLFAVYQSQNPDDSMEAALTDFEQMVRDAIDEGFGEARSIMEGLDGLTEQIDEFIDQTYAILDRLLEEFFVGAAGGELAEIGELAEQEEAGALSGSYWESIELEYQYLSYESLSITQSAGADAAGGAGSYSVEYARLQFESLSVSMSSGQIEQGSALQYLA